MVKIKQQIMLDAEIVNLQFHKKFFNFLLKFLKLYSHLYIFFLMIVDLVISVTYIYSKALKKALIN